MYVVCERVAREDPLHNKTYNTYTCISKGQTTVTTHAHKREGGRKQAHANIHAENRRQDVLFLVSHRRGAGERPLSWFLYIFGFSFFWGFPVNLTVKTVF